MGTERPRASPSESSIQRDLQPGVGTDDQTAMTSSPAKDLFRRFAHTTASKVGSPWSFLVAVAIVVVWGVTGPIFKFSDTWQLVINTGTTIVTFLMVFLIQNTQNRDALAIHLKLDELIRAVSGARNQLVDLEDLTDAELERLKSEFATLRGDTVIERIENLQQRRTSVIDEEGM
jgi:low affinity Fe/Cu permease